MKPDPIRKRALWVMPPNKRKLRDTPESVAAHYAKLHGKAVIEESDGSRRVYLKAENRRGFVVYVERTN